VVRCTPGAPAVRCAGTTATFADLDTGARMIAAALRRRGLGRGARVAVRMAHSLDLMEVALGIMRAGAAFVPIDHRDTDRRARRVLATAGVDLVVGDETSDDGLPVIAAPALRAEGTGPPEDFAPPALADSAYVLFTSGSTGEPKGVVVSHGALGRYLDWAVDNYLCFAGDGAPLYSSVAFDLTITSIFGPLAAGRAVHVVPAEDAIASVAGLLDDGARFDFVKLTPSHLRLLLAYAEDRPPKWSVGCLVLGGEALPADLVRQWRRISPKSVIVNEYGPTEATVGCCVYQIRAGEDVPEPVPIGRPIPAVTLRVLDDQGHPTAPGETGELFIGGDTLADGYAGRPALTADRFVPDASGSGRLYRTGDLVRQRADGQLCYVGRDDDQIKIRGYRIEPREIATVVAGLAGVRECVVRAWYRDCDDVRLVAYVVPAPGAATPTDLRAHLSELLPAYMVPQHIVHLDAVPHTLQGKVDTARLPDPTQG
jgi:amino acid adenylation domain-containing protein